LFGYVHFSFQPLVFPLEFSSTIYNRLERVCFVSKEFVLESDTARLKIGNIHVHYVKEMNTSIVSSSMVTAMASNFLWSNLVNTNHDKW
jgi:hypothetical protein